MAIKNSDGSIYKTSGSLQQFDPENPEFDLFNMWDQEVIGIGGTPIFYYEIFIQANTLDELHIEDRGKLWSPVPICLYGYYDPVPSRANWTVFGADGPTEMMIEFNYKDVLSRLGHAPKLGARIYTPHKRENWVVQDRNVEVFKLWGELRLQLMLVRFQESLTTGEGAVLSSTKQPNFKLNDIKDLSNKGCTG
jgi:hypothetical protein